MKYGAITGDLVASRHSTDRMKVQRETLDALEELNRELGEALAGPLVLTAGDEVQGLLRKPSALVRVIQDLRDRLAIAAVPGQEIVFGVGWGELSTGLPAEAQTVEHLDGPCFHHARAMLESAQKQRTWVRVLGFDPTTDRTLNSMFELMGAIRAGWTPKQHRYTVLTRRFARRIDVAKHVGVRPSVVTESLQASRFTAIIEGEATVRDILAGFDPPGFQSAAEQH